MENGSGRCHEKFRCAVKFNQPSRQLCIWCSLPDGSLATFGFLRLDPCFRRCKFCKKSHDVLNPKPCWNLKLCLCLRWRAWPLRCVSLANWHPKWKKHSCKDRFGAEKKRTHTETMKNHTKKSVCFFGVGSGKERKITRHKTAGIKDLEAKGVSVTRREGVIYCGAKTFWDQKHLSFSGDYRRLRQPQHSVFQNQGPKTPRNRQFSRKPVEALIGFGTSNDETHTCCHMTYAQPEIDQQLIPEVASWCGCRNWHDAILNFQYLVYSCLFHVKFHIGRVFMWNCSKWMFPPLSSRIFCLNLHLQHLRRWSCLHWQLSLPSQHPTRMMNKLRFLPQTANPCWVSWFHWFHLHSESFWIFLGLLVSFAWSSYAFSSVDFVVKLCLWGLSKCFCFQGMESLIKAECGVDVQELLFFQDMMYDMFYVLTYHDISKNWLSSPTCTLSAYQHNQKSTVSSPSLLKDKRYIFVGCEEVPGFEAVALGEKVDVTWHPNQKISPRTLRVNVGIARIA